MKKIKSALCLFLCVLCLTLCCCDGKSQSLTADYKRSASIPVYNFFSEDSVTPENYQEFTSAYMDFAASFLLNASDDESTVLSPLSLYTVLCMTANGASGKTLRELEKTLGEDLTISEINTFIHYLNERVKSLNNDEGFVNSANSMWFRDNYSVKAPFLQNVVNYFDAEVFRTDLEGKAGADKINKWVSDNTSGKIADMLSPLTEDTAAVLVNALLFEDEWVTPYEEEDIYDGEFNGTKGIETVTFMKSNEMLLKSSDARGVMKSYKNTPCKFVAILPDESIDLDTYISTLSGAKLEKLFESASGVNRCNAHIPQFELRKSLSLTDAIKSMGAELMFSDEANFDALTMSEGLKVTDVMQESFIEVTAQGTRAGSSSAVVMKDSASVSQDFEELKFDRPFIFMIVENESNLPLFIGTVKSVG
ncbi:MAG: serpin family protein [Clostridia bacterium]|nr:serpin family protein [Clostridia bacterium]